jgi:hypothetical protein
VGCCKKVKTKGLKEAPKNRVYNITTRRKGKNKVRKKKSKNIMTKKKKKLLLNPIDSNKES